MVEQFEVAVSRYTFVGDQLQEQLSQIALKAVTQEELAALLVSYQLKFVQSALFQNKAVAIGSGNVLPDLMSQQQGGTRICYGMVVYALDGEAPTAQSIPFIVDTFGLELRQSFGSSPRAAAPHHAPTPNLSGLRAHSPRMAQGAL